MLKLPNKTSKKNSQEGAVTLAKISRLEDIRGSKRFVMWYLIHAIYLIEGSMTSKLQPLIISLADCLSPWRTDMNNVHIFIQPLLMF